MKLKLNRNIRVSFILVLFLLILLIAYLLYNEFNIDKYESKMTPIYTYENKATAKSIIYLKPNNIYNGNFLEEGKIYITELIDYINTDFSYQLTGDHESSIEGDYSIIAKVQGFIGDEEEQVTIWEKDFPIIRSKKFNSSDDKVSINENVNLYLADYNTFVTLIEETTKIKSDTNLTLMMEINLTGTTDKGTFEEIITPNIVIPLNTPMFQITTNNIDKPGAIEETIQVQQPINKNQVILYSIIVGILVLALILLIFFTKSAPKKDELEKELNKIFKKHGDRLVALNSKVDILNGINVRSIGDLVKLADEINKPILYKHREDYKEIDKFFITNGEEIYVFDLEFLKPKEEEIANEEQIANLD